MSNDVNKIASKTDIYQYYHRNLSHHFIASMTYLHTTVNWTITIIIGGVFAILVKPPTTNIQIVYLLSALLIITAHFFSRACKAYLNMMRWSTIDRIIITSFASEDAKAAWDAISKYHILWESPLKKSTIIKKLMFEIGYIYFFGIVVAPLVYFSHSDNTIHSIMITLFSLAISGCEVWYGLFKSPYFSKISSLDDAEKYR